MECTQRLECTQDLYGTQTEKIFPEQIGFLGICGEKYPVKKGPNKIGRDPQTCNIVLNLNSISRQHAVINILNQKDFMIMDLDSANKTRLLNKILQPYIPHPLKNGDTLQFGDVFGIFRLLQEDDDLPMTQAIDIPETPVHTKSVSKLGAITMVPESPDVSDRDDSFIIPSQPNGDNHFKSSINFIKPGRTIAIQPVGSNKIDKIYWNSSKKSRSLSLNNSAFSLNESTNSVNINNKSVEKIKVEHQNPPLNTQNESSDSLYTANTQMPVPTRVSPNIYTANTQMPDINQSPSIHTVNTQLPQEYGSPSIHSLATQMPIQSTENLPEVCKIKSQLDLQFDLYAANKENVNNIHNAETQAFIDEPTNSNSNFKDDSIKRKSNNTSDDELLFEEIDDQELENDFYSQGILVDESPPVVLTSKECDKKITSKPAKRCARIESDGSTDCEDFDVLPTQKIPTKAADNESTDCEEDIPSNKSKDTIVPEVNFEELDTQVIDEDIALKPNKEIDLEDMLTQVIDEDASIPLSRPGAEIEDLPTQVIGEDFLSNSKGVKDKLQQFSDEVVVDASPFKIPLQSPLKVKRKDIYKLASRAKPIETSIPVADDENYYAATQEIFQDLCSQRAGSPEVLKLTKRSSGSDEDMVPSSVENYKVGERFPHIKHLVSPNRLIADKSSSEGEEKVDNFVNNLSSQDVREVIGVEYVVKPTRVFSNSSQSDVEVTPKKARPFKFSDIELPDSQEIKTSLTLTSRNLVTESSSDSDAEVNTEDQHTPILYKKKKKIKNDARMDLTKKFAVDALPSRVITRIRKPTVKLLCETDSQGKNILKPKFLSEPEREIDKEIITENITRLKSKAEKSKTNKDTLSKLEKVEVKKERFKKEEQKHNKSDKNIKDVIKVERSIKNKRDKKQDDNTDKNKQIDTDEKPKKEIRNSRRKAKDTKTEVTINSSTEIGREGKTVPNRSEKSLSKKFDVNPETSMETLNSTAGSHRSTRARSTRNQSNRKDANSSTPENTEERPDRRKRAYRNKTKESTEKEPEVRRSKRQIVAKKKEESEPIRVKSILKRSSHEQSTVYNISSESNAESPRQLKRSAAEEILVPNSKRSRSTMASSSPRATPARTNRTHYVLFTAFPYEEVKAKLEKLGAVVVSDVTQCSVLLTTAVKRTFKLLCAVGLGRPVVGPAWVQACADADTIVDPWLYLIKDEATEKRFRFSLQRTLAGNRGFLAGYRVSSTPAVLPDAREMQLIVECSGGTWQEGGPRWVCVSCSADRALWGPLRRRGATLVSTEFILGGVLRQKVDIEANKLK